MLGLILIFIAKAIEVSLTTLRMLYLNKGAKIQASTIGFIEVLIWIKVAAVVLDGIDENPTQMFIYALGFAAGSYVGMMIEDRIGLGYSNLEIVTDVESGDFLADEIRDLGKAVTEINAKGRDGRRVILSIYVRRKNKDKVLSLIREMNINGVVTVSEVQKAYGGFGLKQEKQKLKKKIEIAKKTDS